MVEQVSSLKTDVKYKDTPIGKIPVDWEVVPLCKISGINMGQSPPSKDCNEQQEGLPFYQGNAEFGQKYPSPKKWCKRPKKTAEQGDILISVRAPVGDINIAPHKCCIGRGIAAVRAKDAYDNFLYHSILLHRKALSKICQGSTFESINRKELTDLLISLPPSLEQKKIAEILTTVDDAIEKTTQIIDKTKELKKGLMQRLLTRGIGHKKFKKTEIGEIPVEWDVGDISDYGDIITGNTPRTSVSQYYGKEYPFASPFDLVVCIGSTIGKTGVAGLTLATNQQINSVICKNSDFNFVYYYLTFISKKIKLLSSTQAVPIINKGEFSKIRTPVPPIDEQKEIGSILSSIDDQVEKESNHRDQLNLLKKGLMQVLLTGKLRVIV